MEIETAQDALSVRVGETFGAPDLARVQEAVTALGPFARLTIDFTEVRQCDDAALARLVRALLALERGRVTLRGLTEHHWWLLTYLGVDPAATGAGAAS